MSEKQQEAPERDGDLYKRAREIIDAVFASPCVVETRCFSRMVEVDRLEDRVVALLQQPVTSELATTGRGEGDPLSALADADLNARIDFHERELEKLKAEGATIRRMLARSEKRAPATVAEGQSQ